jgi:NAD(P)H-dependent FMN reductase
MAGERLRLALIVGSTREGRFGPTVARWFADRVTARDDYEIDQIDLADARLPDVLSSSPPAVVAAVGARLAAADAVVIVTPEYNHSVPGPLKSAIDWYSAEWQAKPVGFVSYGGMAGGLRAVEHLRQIFAELHAVTIRDTVSFHGAAWQFAADGQPKAFEATSAAAARMLDQLAWWADALRRARQRQAYAW